ncbi:hypothetical protein D3C86_2019660 [compost metagenome]
MLQADVAITVHRNLENDLAILTTYPANDAVAQCVEQDIDAGLGVVQAAVGTFAVDAQAVQAGTRAIGAMTATEKP